jgi:hypothetical protein
VDIHQTSSPPITSPKQKFIIQGHHGKKYDSKTSPIIKPLPFTITNNKTTSIYHMNRFLALQAHQ